MLQFTSLRLARNGLFAISEITCIIIYPYSAPNHEAYEFEGWKHSFLTQGIIEALNAPGDKKKINGTITDLIMKC